MLNACDSMETSQTFAASLCCGDQRDACDRCWYRQNMRCSCICTPCIDWSLRTKLELVLVHAMNGVPSSVAA